MDLKKFFKKTKTEFAFLKLGPGQKLGEESKKSPDFIQKKSINSPSVAKDTAAAAATAAAANAAANRINAKNAPKISQSSYKREILEERSKVEKELEEAEKITTCFTKTTYLEAPQILTELLFWCPQLFGDKLIASYKVVEKAIDEYLLSSAEKNPHEVAALTIVRGLVKSKLPPGVDPHDPAAPLLSEIRSKRKENLIKIISNLLNSPNDPRFRKLRLENKLISDLMSIDGAELYFKACGFVKQASVQDSNEIEEVFIIPDDVPFNIEQLKNMLELMTTADAIVSELYRDTKFKNPSQMRICRDNLPDEFFTLSKDEIKKRIEMQHQKVEESQMLLTTALRNKLAIGEIRYYKFVLIRVRFPDNSILQGTFHAADTIGTLRNWVSECLHESILEFQLFAPPGTVSLGHKNSTPSSLARIELDDMNSTLTECGLAPCSLLTIQFPCSSKINNFLKDVLQSSCKD